MTLSDNFAFVLARPKSAGNIGSAARAIKNMGFADLRVVASEVSLKSRAALSMAVHAGDVLRNARICKTLGDAVQDCAITAGTTCRTGLYRSAVLPVRQSARELSALARANRIAIIFGPEDTGLTNRELKHCERLITIPASPGYSSLNLAQAVMVVAYELNLSLQDGANRAADAPQFASAAEAEVTLERMKESLLAIGFLPEQNPEHIMFALRGIFGRSGLTARELDILNGIARQTRWAAEGGHRTIAEKKRAGRKLR